jgi:hypothetical protein
MGLKLANKRETQFVEKKKKTKYLGVGLIS